MCILQYYYKIANVTTKGIDVPEFSDYMAKFAGVDPNDDVVIQRLFHVTNTRG